jgi:hypothetical protein
MEEAIIHLEAIGQAEVVVQAVEVRRLAEMVEALVGHQPIMVGAELVETQELTEIQIIHPLFLVEQVIMGEQQDTLAAAEVVVG